MKVKDESKVVVDGVEYHAKTVTVGRCWDEDENNCSFFDTSAPCPTDVGCCPTARHDKAHIIWVKAQ